MQKYAGNKVPGALHLSKSERSSLPKGQGEIPSVRVHMNNRGILGWNWTLFVCTRGKPAALYMK